MKTLLYLQKWISVWMCVIAIGAPGLLTQCRDLTFSENILNIPFLCHFFFCSEINEKNLFFRWDTFKGWKLIKINWFFYFVGTIFILIGIANEKIWRVLKSSNFWSKIATTKKQQKKAKSTLIVLENWIRIKWFRKSSAILKYIKLLPFG